MKNYMSYLDYLNWFATPIDVDKHPTKASWIAAFREKFKKLKNENEKIPAESNKTVPSNSSLSGNKRVVHITTDSEHPSASATVGRVKFTVNTKYNS